MAKSLRRAMPDTASTYITYGLTESLFKSCSSHTDYTIPQEQRTQILSGTGPRKTAEGEDIGVADPPLSESTSLTRTFFLGDGADNLSLLPTFSTWSQTAFLHMYLLTVRLRALPPASSPSAPGSFTNFQQYLLEHFSQTAEDHMLLLHTISARSIRNRYLKDLFIQWRGIIAAYDEGMVKGDAVLGSAVWRNIFKGKEDVDWRKVAMVVAYMRKAVVELSKIKDVDQLPRILDGRDGVWAKSLEGVREMVGKESRGMKEALS
jgi:cytochrome b pre-mRNA-processing protein 3